MKKIICLIVAIAAVFVMLPFNAINVVVQAASNASWYMDDFHTFDLPKQGRTNFTSKKIEVSNAIFADGSITEFSSNASGWEASTASNAVTGVVNTTSFDTFKGNQNLSNLTFMTENPSSSNSGSPNVLVLANKSSNGTASANFSQRLSEFWADGYFEVKVDFYAVGSQSSIYLIPDTNFEDGRQMPRVDVNQVSITVDNSTDKNYLSMWQTATFLIKTDSLESITFKLGLYLGKYNGQAGGGVVYYDNISVRAYSKAQHQQTFEQAKYEAETRTGNYRLTCVVDLSKPVDSNPSNIEPYSATKSINENFDDKSTVKFELAENNFATPDNTNILPSVRISDVPAALNVKEANSQVFGATNNNNKGAMLLTAVNTSVGLRYSEKVTIKRNEIYMVSFYAITSGDTSGYFRLTDTRYGTLGVSDEVSENLYDSGYIAIKQDSTSSAESQNNWILNTIFVVGEALEDIDTYIEFWLGGENNTTGYLMVDDFSITRVSSKYYGKHKSSSNATECNLDWYRSTETINNANFNSGVKRSNVSAYPLVATNWEVTLENEGVTDHYNENRILNGIVNTDSEHWRTNNIVLPDGNRAYGSATWQYMPIVTGNYAQSLNNNVYMMQNVQSTYQRVASSTFTLTSDTRNVISFDASTYKLSNKEVWVIIEVGGHEVTRMPLVNESGSITGLSDWQNYSIVIQTSRFTNAEARIIFALGSEAAPSTGCVYIDNVRVSQSSPAAGDMTVDLNDPSKLYMRTIGDNSDAGGTSLFFIAEDSNTASAFYSLPSDVLSISTTGVSNAIVLNTMTEQIEEEKAYQYTVKLLPNAHVNIDRSYDTTNNPAWGMSIRIKNMDGGFINLKTEDFQKMARVNGFIELRFFIKSGTSLDLALEIEFGNSDVIVEGAIGIKGLELKEITDDQFNAAKEDNLTKIITTSTTTTDDEDSKGSGNNNLNFLIIPSLITGAAIIVAVVGTFIRKRKFWNHIDKPHTSYARDDLESSIPTKDLNAPKAKKAPNKKLKAEKEKE